MKKANASWRELRGTARRNHQFWIEKLIWETKVVVVAKLPQYSPGSLVATPSNEDQMQKEEACGGKETVNQLQLSADDEEEETTSKKRKH